MVKTIIIYRNGLIQSAIADLPNVFSVAAQLLWTKLDLKFLGRKLVSWNTHLTLTFLKPLLTFALWISTEHMFYFYPLYFFLII